MSSCTSSHCVTRLSCGTHTRLVTKYPRLSLVPPLTLCLSQQRSRPLGPLTSRVKSFRIVLADGTATEVVSPTEDTSQMNDDLFWAVRGGSSGNWGVLTEVTLKTYRDEDYFSMFWLEVLVWDTEGAASMFRKYSELANANLLDNRWGLGITVLRDIWVQDQTPGITAMTLEMTWVAPIEQAADYDPTFFQSIRDACTGCFGLLSLPNSVEPLSVSMRFKYVRQYLECAA